LAACLAVNAAVLIHPSQRTYRQDVSSDRYWRQQGGEAAT
jgi:hypothetical protein